MAKLIYIPMFILFAISIFGFLFQNEVGSKFGTGYLQYMGDDPAVAGDDSGYYTMNDAGVLHHVQYFNGTCVDDNGTIETLQTAGSAGPWNHVLMWNNRTYEWVGLAGGSVQRISGGGVYTVKDKDGNVVTSDGVILPDSNGDGIGELVQSTQGLSLFWSGAGLTLGLMGIITAAVAVGSVVGFKFLGSGFGDGSAQVLTAGTAFLSIYCFASMYSVPFLLQVPIFGWVLVFVLSGFYAVGALGYMVHGTGGD